MLSFQKLNKKLFNYPQLKENVCKNNSFLQEIICHYSRFFINSANFEIEITNFFHCENEFILSRLDSFSFPGAYKRTEDKILCDQVAEEKITEKNS